MRRPNLINIVPSHVLMTVDLRNHDGDEMDRATDDLHEYLRAVEERTGTTISVSVTARTPPVHFLRRCRTGWPRRPPIWG